MTYEEIGKVIATAKLYWDTIDRGKEPLPMAKAWALSLEDLDYAAACRGIIELSKTLKFPPTPAEVRTAAIPFQQKALAAKTGSSGNWIRDGAMRTFRRIHNGQSL